MRGISEKTTGAVDPRLSAATRPESMARSDNQTELAEVLKDTTRAASNLPDSQLKSAVTKAVIRWESFLVKDLGSNRVNEDFRVEFRKQIEPTLVKLCKAVERAQDPEVASILLEFCEHEPSVASLDLTRNVLGRLGRKLKWTQVDGLLVRFRLAMESALAAQADRSLGVAEVVPCGDRPYERRVALGRIYRLGFDDNPSGQQLADDAAAREKLYAFGSAAAAQAVATVAADFLAARTAQQPDDGVAGDGLESVRLEKRYGLQPEYPLCEDTSLLQREIYAALMFEDGVKDALPEQFVWGRLWARGEACWIASVPARLPELGDLETLKYLPLNITPDASLVQREAHHHGLKIACLVAQRILTRAPSKETVAEIARVVPDVARSMTGAFQKAPGPISPAKRALCEYVAADSGEMAINLGNEIVSWQCPASLVLLVRDAPVATLKRIGGLALILRASGHDIGPCLEAVCRAGLRPELESREDQELRMYLNAGLSNGKEVWKALLVKDPPDAEAIQTMLRVNEVEHATNPDIAAFMLGMLGRRPEFADLRAATIGRMSQKAKWKLLHAVVRGCGGGGSQMRPAYIALAKQLVDSQEVAISGEELVGPLTRLLREAVAKNASEVATWLIQRLDALVSVGRTDEAELLKCISFTFLSGIIIRDDMSALSVGSSRADFWSTLLTPQSLQRPKGQPAADMRHALTRGDAADLQAAWKPFAAEHRRPAIEAFRIAEDRRHPIARWFRSVIRSVTGGRLYGPRNWIHDTKFTVSLVKAGGGATRASAPMRNVVRLTLPEIAKFHRPDLVACVRKIISEEDRVMRDAIRSSWLNRGERSSQASDSA